MAVGRHGYGTCFAPEASTMGTWRWSPVGDRRDLELTVRCWGIKLYLIRFSSSGAALNKNVEV